MGNSFTVVIGEDRISNLALDLESQHVYIQCSGNLMSTIQSWFFRFPLMPAPLYKGKVGGKQAWQMWRCSHYAG